MILSTHRSAIDKIYKYKWILKSCFHVFVLTVDQIYHLASPASPPNYMYNPIKTLKTNTIGTLNMLGECTRSQLPETRFEFELNCWFWGFFWWLFPELLCVCSKVWPSVWGPDCCWLLLQRFMEVRDTLPNHFQVLFFFLHRHLHRLFLPVMSVLLWPLDQRWWCRHVFLPLSELVTFTWCLLAAASRRFLGPWSEKWGAL